MAKVEREIRARLGRPRTADDGGAAVYAALVDLATTRRGQVELAAAVQAAEAQRDFYVRLPNGMTLDVEDARRALLRGLELTERKLAVKREAKAAAARAARAPYAIDEADPVTDVGVMTRALKDAGREERREVRAEARALGVRVRDVTPGPLSSAAPVGYGVAEPVEPVVEPVIVDGHPVAARALAGERLRGEDAVTVADAVFVGSAQGAHGPGAWAVSEDFMAHVAAGTVPVGGGERFAAYRAGLLRYMDREQVRAALLHKRAVRVLGRALTGGDFSAHFGDPVGRMRNRLADGSFTTWQVNRVVERCSRVGAQERPSRRAVRRAARGVLGAWKQSDLQEWSQRERAESMVADLTGQRVQFVRFLGGYRVRVL